MVKHGCKKIKGSKVMETSTLNIMKKIGIETLADLARFKQEEQKPAETITQTLQRYLKELGEDFEIKGN